MSKRTTRQRIEQGVIAGRQFRSAEVIELLLVEHRRLRATVRKLMTERGHDYMRDAMDKKLPTHTRANASGCAWAIKDLRDELLKAMR